ncbi:MAG: NlpC/P60 family protein [Microcoleaceae cyanobacterium]
MTIDPSSDITHSPIVEYQCKTDLNLYDSPVCKTLATQAAQGRHLWVNRSLLECSQTENLPLDCQGIPVQLCEDGYRSWLSIRDVSQVEPSTAPYQPQEFSRSEIETSIPQVIQFAQQALATPNHYRWGGTLAPHYDCSGLVQSAFASTGIWIPRDAYQQEAFVKSLALDSHQAMLSCLESGDLIFFGTTSRANHVGLYIGDGQYIHSSGAKQGRNGIGIDVLSSYGETVSQQYLQQLRGAGRVVKSYQLITVDQSRLSSLSCEAQTL